MCSEAALAKQPSEAAHALQATRRAASLLRWKQGSRALQARAASLATHAGTRVGYDLCVKISNQNCTLE